MLENPRKELDNPRPTILEERPSMDTRPPGLSSHSDRPAPVRIDTTVDQSRMDTTFDAAAKNSYMLGYGDPKNKTSKGCCSRCCSSMNAFFWRNEAELMKIDHLKAAPCVTTLFLAVMRVVISVVLVLYTMVILIFTS